MEYFIPLSSKDALKIKSPSTFQICLPQRLSLGKNFEVALLEISYPNELYNIVSEKDAKIALRFTNERGNYQDEYFSIPRKSYFSISDLIETINEYLEDYKTTSKISIEGSKICVESMSSEITFSSLLRDILGIRHETVSHSVSYSKYIPNLHQQHNFLNICADVVQPVFYDKRQRQLLRRIQHEGSNKRYIYKTFDNPLYLPVCKTDFEVISVHITNDYGNSICFDRGAVFLLLHIREKLQRNDDRTSI